jgi:hypothetical protein
MKPLGHARPPAQMIEIDRHMAKAHQKAELPDPKRQPEPQQVQANRPIRWTITAVVCSVVSVLIALGTYYHNVQRDDKAAQLVSSDEHTKLLIHEQLDPMFHWGSENVGRHSILQSHVSAHSRGVVNKRRSFSFGSGGTSSRALKSSKAFRLNVDHSREAFVFSRHEHLSFCAAAWREPPSHQFLLGDAEEMKDRGRTWGREDVKKSISGRPPRISPLSVDRRLAAVLAPSNRDARVQHSVKLYIPTFECNRYRVRPIVRTQLEKYVLHVGLYRRLRK